jgi:MoaA/NifB/PqqE/SkfB family radical SAM enzyme
VKQDFDLERYLSDGIEAIVKDALKATLKNPKETAFLTKYAIAAKKAERHRHSFELAEEHIPSFLIASITEECNLHCAGCYAHANMHGGLDTQMSRSDWSRVFREASELGVAMILLAGGEPLLRGDIIEEAAEHPDILFPVFSNGTTMDEKYIRLFDKWRNLVPIISIEGDEKLTDERRGSGIYAQTTEAMRELREKGVLFGASITVTTQNLEAVTKPDFCDNLRRMGCAVMFFVEYVPVERRDLALNPEQRESLQARVDVLRERDDGMILISFPGDEKYSGGCLAAGRGFFHINATGGAEPCPFSPFSDTSLKSNSLRVALRSTLFQKLRDSDKLRQAHTGGCVLFEQSDTVKRLANS